MTPQVLLGVAVGAALLALGGYALYLHRRLDALEDPSIRGRHHEGLEPEGPSREQP